jgi:hypothetical protein
MREGGLGREEYKEGQEYREYEGYKEYAGDREYAGENEIQTHKGSAPGDQYTCDQPSGNRPIRKLTGFDHPCNLNIGFSSS